MSEKMWKIKGFDGEKQIFQQTISLSEPDVFTLLRCLASCHLNEDEVISAFLGNNAHLEVRPNNGGTAGFSTTGGWHYTAMIESGE